MSENPQYGEQLDNLEDGHESPAVQPREQEQSAVEAPLSLDELSQKYAVDSLCGPASMDMIKGGLQGIQWVSIFRNSPFNKGEWEMFLGGYTTECANDGAWKALDAGGDSQYAVEVGMFREADTVDGKKLIPTEKCLKFIQDRLARYTE